MLVEINTDLGQLEGLLGNISLGVDANTDLASLAPDELLEIATALDSFINDLTAVDADIDISELATVLSDFIEGLEGAPVIGGLLGLATETIQDVFTDAGADAALANAFVDLLELLDVSVEGV